MLGNRLQAQGHLGDHGQRPLRPDEKPGEVVAGGCLACAGAGVDDAPVRKHGLERQQVGAHLPVAHRGRSGRIRRGHAPERGVGARVDGEEEPMLARGPLEGEPRHARRDRRGEIAGAISRVPVIPERSRLIPPWTGITWPSRLVPAAYGVTGTRCALASESTFDTSSVVAA